MFGAVGLWGLGCVLACLGLNLTLGGSRAASVTGGLDILLPCLAGLGRGTPWGGIRLRGHNTVAVAWGLAEAGSVGDSRAVTSAGPETMSHELGTDFTAVNASHSAHGWLSGGLERRRLGGGVMWSWRLKTHSALVELELLEISHGWEQPGLYGPPPCSKSESYSTPYSS